MRQKRGSSVALKWHQPLNVAHECRLLSDCDPDVFPHSVFIILSWRAEVGGVFSSAGTP